jgi:hypothetical protein
MTHKTRIQRFRKRFVDPIVFGAYHNFPHNFETSIWEEEWDVCLVLDACRPDILEYFTEDFQFLPGNIDKRWSVASTSLGWIHKTLCENADEASRTIYVTANVHSEIAFSGGELAELDEVWRYAWIDEVGTVPPKAVSDSVIEHGRRVSEDSKIIGHYMQPHFPSIPDKFGVDLDRDDINEGWGGTWGKIQAGELSADDAWKSYKVNTEYVLKEVERVLSNIDGTVLITADHANSWGQWGYWGHPSGKPVPEIRYVPWVLATGEDQKTADFDNWKDTVDVSAEEQLRALGYR